MRTRRVAAFAVLALLASGCSREGVERLVTQIEPLCSPPSQSLILLAQTVQDATHLPCITGFPAGWSYAGQDFRSGSATFWLTSAVAGDRAVEVQLLPSCAGATGTPLIQFNVPGIKGFVTNDPGVETRRFVFDGGCIVQRIDARPGDLLSLAQARGMLGFLDRAALARRLQAEDDVTLCGAGAAPCVG